MAKLTIFCDGGARRNPGPAACAAVIKNGKYPARYRPAAAGRARQMSNGKECVLEKVSRYLGPTLTNNQAEYYAVIEGLKAARKYEPEHVTIYLDSELLVEQLNLRFRLKNATLKRLFAQVQVLKLSFPVVEFRYIPREKNKEADALVNEVLDRELGSRQ